MSSESPELLRLSTAMFPERDRTAAFQEAFARHIVNFDVTDFGGSKAHLDLIFLNLGMVAVGNASVTDVEFIRDSRHIQDGVGDFHLVINGEGAIRMQHAGQEHAFGGGTGILYDFGRSQSCIVRYGDARTLTVRASALKALVAHPEDLAGHIIHHGPALSLLNSYLLSIASLEAPPPAELRHLIGLHLLDLMAAVLGPTAEGQEIIAGRGLKSARLHAVIAEIGRQFSDPSLDLNRIANQLGMSRRYIQRLLEETGKSFTEHVTERRLQRAYEMLVNPGLSRLRIINIALDLDQASGDHVSARSI